MKLFAEGSVHIECSVVADIIVHRDNEVDEPMVAQFIGTTTVHSNADVVLSSTIDKAVRQGAAESLGTPESKIQIVSAHWSQLDAVFTDEG